MPPEILALFEKPYLLIAVLAVGAIVGMIVEQLFSKMRRQAWRKKRRFWNEVLRKSSGAAGPRPTSRDQVSLKQPDAADQLRIVMGASFSIQPLLNKSEARVFIELDRIVTACNPTWHVMAQVSLGEVLRSKDADAYRCINSKRVDLLLMDGACQPRHAMPSNIRVAPTIKAPQQRATQLRRKPYDGRGSAITRLSPVKPHPLNCGN